MTLTQGGPLVDSTIDPSNYFDSTKTCSGCTETNGTASASTDALYDPANAPVSGWDPRVWQTQAGSPPTLR
jgi:hypothetical protein